MKIKYDKLSQRVHRNYLLDEAENFREHKKGIPEWLKNADDSYTRHEEFDKVDFSTIPILLNFSKEVVMCLDFGGADGETMIEHIPFYGSPQASTHGKKMTSKTVSGGHGNGGKYYALSQFKECQVISYFNKKLSMLTLKGDGDYTNFKNFDCSPYEVIKLIGADEMPYFETTGKELFEKMNKGELNLFCWRGIKPKDIRPVSNKTHLSKLVDSIANHPQARSALRSRKVDVLWRGELFWPSLKPNQIEVDTSFGTKEFPLPKEIEGYEFNNDHKSVLRVTLSKNILTGDHSSLNILEIDANGRNVAYYDLPSFSLDKGYARYLVAHIDCPDLKSIHKCISNDRVQLKEKEVSSVFLSWCREKIQEVIDLLREKEKVDTEGKNKEELGSFLNEALDEFSDLLEEEDILKKIYDSQGQEKGIVTVSTNDPGYGGENKLKKKGGGKRKGGEEQREDKSSEKKGKSSIKILVSNHDSDPLNPGNKYNMIEREPILNQRVQDIPHGIWWINSQKKYIKNLEVKDSRSWPFYFLLIKEIVYSHRQRKRFKEGEGFEPDGLEQLNFDLIDEVFNRAVEKFKIETFYDESVAEKIRSAIKNKSKFNIPDLAKELEINPMAIHSFIAYSKPYIEERFITKYGKISGHKTQIKVFVKR